MFLINLFEIKYLQLGEGGVTIGHKGSSRGGLEVEQWSLNRTLSISVDQSPFGACIIIWYQWTCYVMYDLDVCYMCV